MATVLLASVWRGVYLMPRRAVTYRRMLTNVDIPIAEGRCGLQATSLDTDYKHNYPRGALMALSALAVEAGLLAHNFFPRVARRGDEFPPCFVSVGFSSAIASKLNSLAIKRNDGYGAIAARSTRYDLAPRNMEIVHPRAFAAIARHLKTTWSDWNSVITNPSSAIRVGEHEDGRVFSMVTSVKITSLDKPGGRFQAKVDITNFYGSIYTHSFPWAVRGLHTAKADQDNKNDWANSLDFLMRQARRRETTGISVGPGTSGIAGEILLAPIDQSLRNLGFEFFRYIDDYYFVDRNRDRVEAFVRAVRDLLAELKLSIHPGKTAISELPSSVTPRWMRSLRAILRSQPTINQLFDLLDEAIEVSDTDPDDGAIRYALVAIEDMISRDQFTTENRTAMVDRLLHIGYLRPIAIGSACRLLATLGHSAVADRKEKLDLILQEHASALRTDAVTWILHTLAINKLPPSSGASDAIVRSGDCLAMALLARDTVGSMRVKEFVASLEAQSPPDYRRDEYWLLYYQFALEDHWWDEVPPNFYAEFEPLLEARVSFIDFDATNPYLPFHTSVDSESRIRTGIKVGGYGQSPYAD